MDGDYCKQLHQFLHWLKMAAQPLHWLITCLNPTLAEYGSPVPTAAGKKCKREKLKQKRKLQMAEDDFVHQVDVRFEAFNGLVREGLLTQEMLEELRDKAVQEHNAVDKQVCDMLII